MRMKDDQWDAVIAINLKGTFLFTRAATRPMMKARRGESLTLPAFLG